MFCFAKERKFKCASCGKELCKGCIYAYKFHSKYKPTDFLCGSCFYDNIDLDVDIKRFIFGQSIPKKEGEVPS